MTQSIRRPPKSAKVVRLRTTPAADHPDLGDWEAVLARLAEARTLLDAIALRSPGHLRAVELRGLVDRILATRTSWLPGIDDGYRAAARRLRFAPLGRPQLACAGEMTGPELAPLSAERLDTIDRCLRAADAFVDDATRLLEDPTGADPAWRSLLAERLDGAEQQRKNVKGARLRKRLRFLEAVAFVSWAEEEHARRGETYVPVEEVLARIVSEIDVPAAGQITGELARRAVVAWRRGQGEKDKWTDLAEACQGLGFGQVAGATLKRDWNAAVGEARASSPPRHLDPRDNPLNNPAE